MLYFSVILCIRQFLLQLPSTQFVAQIYVPHVSLHHVFRPDGVIFRYVWVTIACFSFCYVPRSPSYKQQRSKTQEHATEIRVHTNSTPRTRTPKTTTYRHQLRLTGYFHVHVRIVLDHGKDVYHYLE
jgi:hypothetical protein